MSNADEIEDTSAPLIEHLAELRSRLIKSLGAFVVAMVICFTVWNPIFDFLTQPLCDALAENGQQDCGLVMIALQEGFFVAVSISMLGGLVLSFPVISYQLWRFVAPGLYKSEKNAFLPFLLASPIMFILGAAFAFYVITPMAFTFFLNFQQAGATAGTEATSAGINYLGSAQSYLSLTMKFIIAFGLCFQLPVLLTLMGKAGLVSADGLRSVRKYAVVGILILAAIATPPDVVSQIILFSVVYGLYEVSIQLVARVEKARIERLKAEGLYFEDDDDEADDEAKA
ncbi:MAG: twin-arginine translocase subunit TatC [Marivivens sp.]|jgi:sec-independent protein translocase protein TatC|uniref:twin-arginine translocase subunit TatC n=1 Tax=Marivivens sp. TaxID=1978374 RepID=UPI00201E9E5C|nr:twin-arginine translocase subunit TatC [Marivivens sp.]MCL7405558.1 twin-arginine translocase subunit TatC [Marivivens geojensis]NBQ50671.1 twin-arginine translocase subunit TatC [Marivivens sp.]NBX09904.1 twin-arginine translocase subunit TatC [Marivivens sp.]NDH03124.1 twin-arginine translocase subunit TatC [Marivivens sp.]